MVLKHNKILLALASVGIAFLAVKPLINPVPLVIWNASKSVPIGWYIVAKRQPKIGEIAVIKPVDWVQIYASSRGYGASEDIAEYGTRFGTPDRRLANLARDRNQT
jgi:type IV secretory pathway protease TraF